MGKRTEPIVEPPLIPAAPMPAKNTGTAPASDIQVYADMLEWENARQYPPELANAVARAIQLEVLKPTNLQERFGPEQPLTYGEFRKWALAYQSALYGYQALPSAETLAEAKLVSANTSPDLTGPMSPEKLFILPEKLETGSGSMQPNQALTREALCYLYFLLTRQQSKLRQLSTADMEAAFPSSTGSGAEESLSQFKDYAVISAWARPAVALFYQSGQLQQLFRQTASQLIIDDGFGPKKAADRAESIVLLHWVYGKVLPTVPAPVEAAQTPEVTGPHVKLRLPDEVPSTAQPTLPPSPMGHLKLFEEKSPQGRRQAFSVDGPE